MENATKALLIAAGVMIGTILITIGFILFKYYRGVAKGYETQMTLQEVAKINKEFEKYRDKKNITPQEVIAAVTTAESINERYEDTVITVTVPGLSSIGKQAYVDFIKGNLEKNYSCNILEHKATTMKAGKEVTDPYYGIVEFVTFTEI